MLNKQSYTRLRKSIRSSAKKYRREASSKDKPIFNAEHTYEYAYVIADVEDALDTFEEELPLDFKTSNVSDGSMEAEIVEMAIEIVSFSKSMEARDFARTVRAYFAIEENRRKTPWPTLESITVDDN